MKRRQALGLVLTLQPLLPVAARAQATPESRPTAPAELRALLTARNVVPMTAVVDRQGLLQQLLPGEMFEDDVLELLQLANPKVRS